MSEVNLIKHFKQSKILSTDIGDFEFSENISQGGNARVLEFKKDNKSFAIKFIPHADPKKLSRFKDEFFCAAQIPTHKNIARAYHFDTIEISESQFSIVIMKRYGKSLHEIGPIKTAPLKDREERAINLFKSLCSGLAHLHRHQIIHRDIKPQNIFFDEAENDFVIGDLGIAHFNSESFPREAITKPAERLANYLFSAPEQVDSKNPPSPTNDIYALGQVIQWFLCGATIRGLGRKKFCNPHESERLARLDAVIEKCLMNNQQDRFQSIPEIKSFIENTRETKPSDPWTYIHQLDETIRSSFPRIERVEESTKPSNIERFFNNFQKQCDPKDFWYVNADGGDNEFLGIHKINESTWLLNEIDEIEIKKLIIYRDGSYPYKDFFIILTNPSNEFEYFDFDGNPIYREKQTYYKDRAYLFEGKYIDPDEIKNGYYMKSEDEILKVNYDNFSYRERYLKPYAFLIVPKLTASACMLDRTPSEDLLESAIRNQGLNIEALKIYLDKTRKYHSDEITKWN